MKLTTREVTAHVELASPVQVAGLVLLVAFAGTFGARWALLAAGLALLFVGVALTGVRLALRLVVPVPAADQAPAAASGSGR